MKQELENLQSKLKAKDDELQKVVSAYDLSFFFF